MTPLRPLTSCLRRHASTIATPIKTAPYLPRRRIKIFPPIPAPPTKDPIPVLTKEQLSILDPTGARAAQFSRKNPSAIQPGDIVYVRRKNGEPFSGVLINIRRRGVDTAILLRDHLTKVGVEMWLKVFSPVIDSVNLVMRRPKRSRRAKLYYMRFVLTFFSFSFFLFSMPFLLV
jgi:ribosomal protein L19